MAIAMPVSPRDYWESESFTAGSNLGSRESSELCYGRVFKEYRMRRDRRIPDSDGGWTPEWAGVAVVLSNRH